MINQIKNKYTLRFGNKDLPSYLIDKHNIIRTIIFATVFSLFFINIFRPFNSDSWIPESTSYNYFLYSSLMVLIGMLVISLSRMLMYFFTQKITIGYLEYLIWILAEIVIVSVFYVFIANKVGFVDKYLESQAGISFTEAVFNIFRKAFANTIWMLLIPYVISWLYLENEKVNGEVQSLRNEKQNLINDMQNVKSDMQNVINEKQNVINDMQDVKNDMQNKIDDIQKKIDDIQKEKEKEKEKEKDPKKENNVIQFRDDKGEVRFTVTAESIIYIESADNYVIIKYLLSHKVSEFILRTSLKRITDELEGSSIQRCHRSFMVNCEHVLSLKKDNGEICLEFDVPNIKEIPVSKSYNDKIMQAFVNYTGQK